MLAVFLLPDQAKAQVPPIPSGTTCGNLATAESGGAFGTLPPSATVLSRDLQIPPPAIEGYTFGGTGANSVALEGKYVVTTKANSPNVHPTALHWQGLPGHNAGAADPGDPNDAYLAVNGAATTNPGRFYIQNVTLVANQQYRLSTFAINAINLLNYSGNLPNVEVRVLRTSDNFVVAAASTGLLPVRQGIAYTGPSNWTQATVDFNSGTTTNFRIEVRDLTTTGVDNDLAIDDVTIAPLAQAGCPTDFGDAPDTATGTSQGNYQTLLADNGARHGVVAGLFIGTAATAELDALQNAAATGDADDGVAAAVSLTLVPGQAVTIPVSVSNTTGTNAFLNGFMDFNRDGDFVDAGEAAAAVITVPNSGATQTVNLSFTVPAAATAGISFMRLRLARVAGEVASSTGVANAGEVEDYQIVLRPTVALTKVWTNAIATNSVSLSVTATGATNVVAGSSTAGGTTTNASAVVGSGATVTLAEAFTSGSAANYTTTLACTRTTDGVAVAVSGSGLSRTILAPGDSSVTCTYANARPGSLTLRKQWAGAVVGDDATITVSRAGTVIDTLASDAGAAGELDTDATPTVVNLGETLVLAETLAAGNAGSYNTALACTGTSDSDPTDGLTVGANDTAIVCTYTNTRQSADLSINKTNTPGTGPSDQANDTVSSGVNTTYTLTVSNNGPNSVTGAVVKDVPASGITCPPGNAVTITGNGVPAGSFTVANLTSAAGIALGALGAGQSAVLMFTCQVN